MLIAGNWKMFKGPEAAGEFCRALRELDLGGCEVVVCPPFVSLAAAALALFTGLEAATLAAFAFLELLSLAAAVTLGHWGFGLLSSRFPGK